LWLTACVLAAVLIATGLGVLAGLITGHPAYGAELCRSTGCHDLARVVWSESRGESWQGQLAVAAVVKNRLEAGDWGSTISAVIRQPKQFSAFNTAAGRRRLERLSDSDPAYRLAQIAALLTLAGAVPDPTHGAVYFFSAGMKTPPSWARGLPRQRIGNHIFLRKR
jgi:spore germination cell wall hydrolase CwlJ-like protein